MSITVKFVCMKALYIDVLVFLMSSGTINYACKRKDEQQINGASQPATPKKPRLVFTDIQRRTLQ
ncbi:hypothetical protein X798_05604, partial [Onchocerca flexuosa]